MNQRKINRIIKATAVDMGGFKVDQPLPNFGMAQFDPFLLIHHARHEYPGGNRASEIGVGPHPHRGFSPVTFIFQGSVHHRDSRGNNQVVEAGGMQWMSAGMGIIHSERPSSRLAEEGGIMEIVQIWINTPKEQKMAQPFYLPVQNEDVPEIITDNDRARIRIYAGNYQAVTGPAPIPFPMTLIRLDLKAGASVAFDSHAGQNSLIYQLNGETEINGRKNASKSMVVFEKEGGEIQLHSNSDSQLIYLSGEPLNEPVASHGPYVMNNQTELLEAMRDYQMGKMGVLIEEF